MTRNAPSPAFGRNQRTGQNRQTSPGCVRASSVMPGATESPDLRGWDRRVHRSPRRAQRREWKDAFSTRQVDAKEKQLAMQWELRFGRAPTARRRSQ